jgi:hypothetical protein
MSNLTKFSLAIAAFIGLFALNACGCISGKGEITSETRDIGGFTKIIIEGSADVNITQSDTEDVTVITNADLMEYITTTVDGSTLTISTKQSLCYDKLDVNIRMKNLEGVKIEGSGNVMADGDFKAEEFKVKISGSGDIKIKNIDVEELEASISGSGSIKLRGEAEEAEFEIDGSGDIFADEVECDAVDVEINGSGNCFVWANSSLKIETNGSGDVKYKGDPGELKIEQNGNGEVSKIE